MSLPDTPADMQDMTVEQAEAHIRELRRVMFDLSEADQELAGDRIDQLKLRVKQQPPLKGPFSGLTGDELAKTGTSEADWY